MYHEPNPSLSTRGPALFWKNSVLQQRSQGLFSFLCKTPRPGWYESLWKKNIAIVPRNAQMLLYWLTNWNGLPMAQEAWGGGGQHGMPGSGQGGAVRFPLLLGAAKPVRVTLGQVSCVLGGSRASVSWKNRETFPFI